MSKLPDLAQTFKPTPSLGSASERASALESRLAMAGAKLKTKVSTKSGKPIYNFRNILQTINPIAKLLRMIFVDRDVTNEELDAYHELAEKSKGKYPRDINTDRNNMKKALVRERMSVQQFEKILTILDLLILDMSYTLQDLRTGEIREYKLSDIQEFIEACANDPKKQVISLLDEAKKDSESEKSNSDV